MSSVELCPQYALVLQENYSWRPLLSSAVIIQKAPCIISRLSMRCHVGTKHNAYRHACAAGHWLFQGPRSHPQGRPPSPSCFDVDDDDDDDDDDLSELKTRDAPPPPPPPFLMLLSAVLRTQLLRIRKELASAHQLEVFSPVDVGTECS